MKKLLALMLAAAMCLSFAACGTDETPVPEKPQNVAEKTGQEVSANADKSEVESPVDLGPDIDPVIGLGAVEDPEPDTVEAPAAEIPEEAYLYRTLEAGDTTYNFYTISDDNAMIHAYISAVNPADGSEKWHFATEPQYVGQLDNYTVVGLTAAGFVFTKEDIVYCLDPLDGSLEWTSEPMGIWPGGYFAVDNSCNLYFPGQFTASLVIIDAGGNTVNNFEELESVYGYPIEDGWCEGIEFGSDGYLRMKYSNTYVIDTETGCAADEYPTTVSVEKSMLSGCWKDGFYGEDNHIIMTVDDDLAFSMTTYNSDGSILFNYDGYFELSTFVEEVGNDWLISHLTYTDDAAFADWDGIGDYVTTYFYQDGEDGERTLELVQINNGDSVLYDYFDMTEILLRDFEPMG